MPFVVDGLDHENARTMPDPVTRRDNLSFPALDVNLEEIDLGCIGPIAVYHIAQPESRHTFGSTANAALRRQARVESAITARTRGMELHPPPRLCDGSQQIDIAQATL